ncbi:HAMP domain-containing histidine kinase [Thermosipho ferrireducens]|uniref:histidine kinase n=1 Tax=Thermosipho ferrireducens TaxID=2571116 RepID=A0ABX7S449_9BACT|nr:HAMP domain-containing sensor histidine kinase [Thermosipho ferrireducens]QTA37189.1 HAMP domain-containing histidine kinase [Thermosipho ferrireducens]
MSLSTKITLVTTLVVTIVMSIVLTGIYLLVKQTAINTQIKDISSIPHIFNNIMNKGNMSGMMQGMMWMGPRRDFYVSKNGKVVLDPYGIGPITEKGLKKIDNRYYIFLSFPSKVIIGRDITPTINFVERIKILFVFMVILSSGIVTVLTFFITRSSTKHLRSFVKQIESLDGRDLGFRLLKPNTHDEVDELIEKFNKLMERLEKYYKLQEEFVSNVSHELKTPIANLIGYTEMLKRWGSKNKEVLEESINSICETAYTMKHLVENMLFISSNVTLELTPIELKKLVSQIVAEKEKQYGKKILLSGEGTIVANEKGLERIISILLDNAIQHGSPPFEVQLYKNSIVVIDHGKGISKEEQSKIFERFYKSRSSKGHGLGLFIVKTLCEQMNLKIHLESYNGFTKFEITGGESGEK